MLSIGEKDNDFVNTTIKSMRKHNLPLDILNSDEIKTKYPMITYPDDFMYVLDHVGGILRADKALKAFQVRIKVTRC